jgi:hypothetical protein
MMLRLATLEYSVDSHQRRRKQSDALLLRINETESPSNSATRISVHVLKTMRPKIASSKTSAHS